MTYTYQPNRLPDPRADAARKIIYTAVPSGHIPVAIEQHTEPYRHINRSLLISAEYAMLCSPAPYHPVDPENAPKDAERANVDFLDQTSQSPTALINIIHDEDSIQMKLNMPILIDGYGHEDINANVNPALLHQCPRNTAVELAYLAITEQIDEDKFDEADEIRSLQYRASMAASQAVDDAIQKAAQSR